MMKTLRSIFVAWMVPILLWAADPVEIALWDGDAPGSEGQAGQERVRVTASGEHVVSNVHRPALTPYLAASRATPSAAVLVIPGGGHRELWMDHEGHHAARALAQRGIAAFVLKYRLARETNSIYKIEPHALADTQRALRLIRHRAKEWNIDPERVGVMGFSAGGELAALASLRPDPADSAKSDAIDRLSSKPAFQALIYPGGSSKIVPSKEAPPAFLACAYDDRPDISEGLAQVYLRFKQAGVAAELHIYGSGGHGFGVRPANIKPVAAWLARFEEWLQDGGFHRP